MATRKRAKRVSKRHPKPLLRRHSVSATIGVQELSKAGTSIKLFVHRDELKLGELDIGRGAIYWRGGNGLTGLADATASGRMTWISSPMTCVLAGIAP